MIILRNPDGSFYPVGFFDFPGQPGTIVLVPDIAAIDGMAEDEYMLRVPRHDPVEFRQWCADRNLRISEFCEDPSEGEEVHFGWDEKLRFEFKLRWNA